MESAQDRNSERWWIRAGLAAISGVFLGLSFPPSPFYSLAYVAFIPLFFVFARANSYTQLIKATYIFLFIFHLLTVYWTGGFIIGKDVWMMTAGVAVLLIHPMFFLPFILLSFFVKKRSGVVQGLVAFALFWTTFEYLHSLGEYSFPWLTVGNSQAYDLSRIQIIEYTSIYGLSLLIFAFNIIAFLILWNQSAGRWSLRSKQTLMSAAILLILYFGPALYGKHVMKKESENPTSTISAGIIQPNFDPWEKWGGTSIDKWPSYIHQFNYYLDETKQLARSNPDIILWPETAIPFHILLPRHYMYYAKLASLVDSLNIPVYSGLPTAEFYDSIHAPATAERIGMSQTFVQSYNSAAFILPHRVTDKVHKKSILVPFAERIPYAETFRWFIEPLKWNVGISSWGKGNDTVVCVLPLKDGRQVQFSGMICYESVYPNYVREFVQQGAEFLVVITNDSWWGNTSGAYQHAAFASLRAVETRRWVVQCANGGISLVVDPCGTIQRTTKLYTSTTLVAGIGLRSDQTFYVRYGDVVGKGCFGASLLMLLAVASQIFGRKYHGNDRSEK
jgi:apolipoprotein N-acyltransferase